MQTLDSGPISDAAQHGWNAESDGDRIIANALVWVCLFDHTGPAVAVMGSPTTASWNYDVRAKLLSQRVFSKVDVYDTRTILPSVSDMQNYCSILVKVRIATVVNPRLFSKSRTANRIS